MDTVSELNENNVFKMRKEIIYKMLMSVCHLFILTC